MIPPALGMAIVAAPSRAKQPAQRLDVSYDPTHELYREIDQTLGKQSQAKAGHLIFVQTSSGSSGAQARAVLDGQKADVVTTDLADGYRRVIVQVGGTVHRDINHARCRTPEAWQRRDTGAAHPRSVRCVGAANHVSLAARGAAALLSGKLSA
jgi:ABC-type sulfate transport system substrate-binding protein